MLVRLRPFCTLAVTICLLAPASISFSETLQEAVKHVVESNPEVRTVVYNRLARDQQVKQARAGYFPQLDFIAGAGFREIDEPVEESLEPWEFTLSLRQNVFRGLQDMNEIDRQQARVRSEAYNIQTEAEDNALDGVRAYLQVLKKGDFVALAEENLAIHKRIGDQIRLRSESGIDRRADMNQVQSRLALAESNMVVTETNLLDSETNYLRIVGHMPENLVKPDPIGSLLPDSFEEVQELAITGDPTLKSAEEDLEARHEQDEVAKAPFMPIVDIEVDKNWSEDLDYGLNTKEEDLIALLRVRYNLFRGWKDRARKVETSHLISESREIRNNTHRQVIERTRLSWMAYQATLARIQYLEDRVDSTTMAAEAYTKQWDIRKRTLLDVLDSQAERIEAQQDLLDAKYDGLFAQYRILNNIGKLVHSLGLEWPEEAYVEEEEKPKTSINYKENLINSRTAVATSTSRQLHDNNIILPRTRPTDTQSSIRYVKIHSLAMTDNFYVKTGQAHVSEDNLEYQYKGMFLQYGVISNINQLSPIPGLEWPEENFTLN